MENSNDFLVFCGICSEFQEFIPVIFFESIFQRWEIDIDSETFEQYPKKRIAEKSKSYILECPKCKHTHFMKKWLTDDIPMGNPQIYPSSFPWQKKIKFDNNEFPTDLFNIYKEIINTYNNGYEFSCGILCRLIIESIAHDKGLVEANLYQKINKLSVEVIQKETLHYIRELGNNTVHKGYKPSRKELNTAIFFIENIIIDLYFTSSFLEKYSIINEEFNKYKYPRR